MVPGLWMPAAAMALLAARLSRAGYATRVFTYRGRGPFDANVERLARFAREGERPAHFVGHSLGGVLILDALSRYRDIPAGRVLLLGAPVRGCLAGRRFASHGIGRWMMGACGSRWLEHEARWPRPEPLGVVAGIRPLGLSAALSRLPGDNDGVVRVAETGVHGMAARVLVPEGHSMLLVSGRVGRLVERFLAAGRFE